VLRAKRPEMERPYRVSGYPLTPALYLVGAGFFILYIFIGAPVESMLGLGFVVIGVPVYLWFRRGRAAAAVSGG